jgi:hypothetical protein
MICKIVLIHMLFFVHSTVYIVKIVWIYRPFSQINMVFQVRWSLKRGLNNLKIIL